MLTWEGINSVGKVYTKPVRPLMELEASCCGGGLSVICLLTITCLNFKKNQIQYFPLYFSKIL